ncbi:LIC_10190 family membrane protein [Butyrivibrio sp. JL13D10]|uniref:LIC_10190 family membrane protein n=1 Tax=Butyrivibrio sp. JL13D10 TaxID=3236815 RepID=UPI0038B55114
MLAVIANWIYVIITTYIIGFAVLEGIASISCMHVSKGQKRFVYSFKYNESYLVAGILVVNVYAELFSLISRVSLAANLVLILACALLYYEYREAMNERLINGIGRVISTGSAWLYLAIFLLMAYGTSHGLMHYDTDLYHAQAIRWIEEFGTIKGLGNLHLRLGYNSASFALSALYSGSFWGKQMHAMAGYFALLLAWLCADLKSIERRGHVILSDFVRVTAIYYLFTIFDEMVSPASDYFMATMVFYIVIQWLDLNSSRERAFLPYALLSICAVYVTTIKLSAAPLLLLSLHPIIRISKKEKKKGLTPIMLSVLFCLIIAAPYFVRNVIQTGWLIYPFTGIDLFNFSWKIPFATALSDANEITVYGRGFTDPSKISEPLRDWFPEWYTGLSKVNKGMLILDALSIPVYIGCAGYYIVRRIFRKKKKAFPGDETISKIFHLSRRRTVSLSDFLFIEGVTYICLVYFLLTSPLIRYGCVYLWLPTVIMMGRFVILFDNRFDENIKRYIYRIAVALFAVFMMFKFGVLIRDDYPRFKPSYLVAQQPYNSYVLKEKQINGNVFYYPEEGDRTGYELFPSTPNPDGFNMGGDKITDGFLPNFE